MDAFLALVAVLAMAIPAALAGAFMTGRGAEAIARAFTSTPVAPDPWPRGVQEEDPSFERTWRLGPSRAVGPPTDPEDDDEAPRPTARRVVATVHRR